MTGYESNLLFGWGSSCLSPIIMRVYAGYRLDSAALVVDNSDLAGLLVEVLERRLYCRHDQPRGDVLLGVSDWVLSQSIH